MVDIFILDRNLFPIIFVRRWEKILKLNIIENFEFFAIVIKNRFIELEINRNTLKTKLTFQTKKIQRLIFKQSNENWHWNLLLIMSIFHTLKINKTHEQKQQEVTWLTEKSPNALGIRIALDHHIQSRSVAKGGANVTFTEQGTFDKLWLRPDLSNFWRYIAQNGVACTVQNQKRERVFACK